MNRPLPMLTDTNRFFWTSGADGMLRFLRCDDCRAWAHPPQPVCRNCQGSELSPEAVSTISRGTQLFHRPTSLRLSR